MSDFIENMVDPETLEIAPPVAEHDVVYDFEWDDVDWKLLDKANDAIADMNPFNKGGADAS